MVYVTGTLSTIFSIQFRFSAGEHKCDGKKGKSVGCIIGPLKSINGGFPIVVKIWVLIQWAGYALKVFYLTILANNLSRASLSMQILSLLFTLLVDRTGHESIVNFVFQ